MEQGLFEEHPNHFEEKKENIVQTLKTSIDRTLYRADTNELCYSYQMNSFREAIFRAQPRVVRCFGVIPCVQAIEKFLDLKTELVTCSWYSSRA